MVGSKKIKKDKRTRKHRRSVDLGLRMRAFELPPVKDAILVGRRAPIGPQALLAALNQMVPDGYALHTVDDEVVEAVIIRTSSLRMVGADTLVPVLLEQGRDLIDDELLLHVELSMEVVVSGLEVTT